MALLERLSEPAFARDSVIRPSARALGAVLIAFNVLWCIQWFASPYIPLPYGFQARLTPLELAVGALMPQLLVIVGGVWMVLGDPRGKRLVVLSILVGFVYSVAYAMQNYDPVIALGVFSTWLAFVYYLVVTSQVGIDPKLGRRALSSIVMLFVVGVLVLYAQIVLYALTYNMSHAVTQASDCARLLLA